MMPEAEVDLKNVPLRYLRVALVCVDQGSKDFGYVVFANPAILGCPQREREKRLVWLQSKREEVCKGKP